MLTRELLKLFDWTETHLAEPALAAAEALARSGLTRDAVVVWLDQVYNEPQRYLGDPVLAPLARARISSKHWPLDGIDESCCRVAQN